MRFEGTGTYVYDVRDVPGLKKKPSTSELPDWLKLLLGALLKNEQDVHLFERLAFMTRRKDK